MGEFLPLLIWQTIQVAAQAQNQICDLGCPNIHSIYDDLLENKKKLDPKPDPRPKTQALYNIGQNQDTQEEA